MPIRTRLIRAGFPCFLLLAGLLVTALFVAAFYPVISSAQTTEESAAAFFTVSCADGSHPGIVFKRGTTSVIVEEIPVQPTAVP